MISRVLVPVLVSLNAHGIEVPTRVMHLSSKVI